MSEISTNNESLDTLAQDNFYESSKKWVLSLKERHDPEDLFGILDNNPQKYPYQKIGSGLLSSYQPSFADIREAGGRQQLQAEILGKFELMCSAIMGRDNFNNFIADLLASGSSANHKEGTLRNVWGRLHVPRHNVLGVAVHPNVKALPIFSLAAPIAFSHAEFFQEKSFASRPFDLFEFSRQNLMIVNPALSVASFGGVPVFEELTKYATLIQAVPPTRSARDYGIERQTRRKINRSAKDSLSQHLESLYAENKSAYLTIDYTASTADPIIENGELVALRRKPVARTAKEIIMSDFNFAVPMTMFLNGEKTAWNIGLPTPLTRPVDFDEMVERLNQKTEEITGVPVIFDDTERKIGETALSHPETD